MDVETLFKMKLADRVKWYCSKLCAYQDQLFESALRNNVPSQLIAVTILNELGDINRKDQLQEAMKVPIGSVGPGQLDIDTVLKYNLVDIPLDVQARNDAMNRVHPQRVGPYFSPPPPRDLVVRTYVAQRLRIMQVAIEAAAREIARLLTDMAENRMNSWQKQHQFNAPTPKAAPHPDVYFQEGSIRGLTDKERFEQLCELVTAAYNSPRIVIAMNPGKSFLAGGGEAGNYRNGRIHGFNGCFVGWEVFQEGLFVQRP